jgi:hypothetical protein
VQSEEIGSWGAESVTKEFEIPDQMIIVCMPRIKLSYIQPECKHKKPMSLLYRILLQKLITSPERNKQQKRHHLATGR